MRIVAKGRQGRRGETPLDHVGTGLCLPCPPFLPFRERRPEDTRQTVGVPAGGSAAGVPTEVDRGGTVDEAPSDGPRLCVGRAYLSTRTRQCQRADPRTARSAGQRGRPQPEPSRQALGRALYPTPPPIHDRVPTGDLRGHLPDTHTTYTAIDAPGGAFALLRPEDGAYRVTTRVGPAARGSKSPGRPSAPLGRGRGLERLHPARGLPGSVPLCDATDRDTETPVLRHCTNSRATTPHLTLAVDATNELNATRNPSPARDPGTRA
jgi:hypothetical protein